MVVLKNQLSKKLKEKKVKDLVGEINNAQTLMVISIKGMPSKQFQDIKKQLRENVKIRVAKKNILNRVIESINEEEVSKLKDNLGENCALAISEIEGFELAGKLLKNTTPMFAKAGQIAPKDIEIKEGPTDLMPGPAISEMSGLGVQIAVENGKIAVKKTKVVVQKGKEITEAAASMFQKLNIQPMSIGLEPLAFYDIQNKKTYNELNIDSDKAKSELIDAASKALGFAQKIVYYCKDTIGYFLAKADIGAKHLNSIGDKNE